MRCHIHLQYTVQYTEPVLARKMQGVFQVIDTERGAVDNLVKFKFASLINGSLSVAGTVAPAQVVRLSRLRPSCCCRNAACSACPHVHRQS